MKTRQTLLPRILLPALLIVVLIGASRLKGVSADPNTNAGWEEVGTGSASGGGISNTSGRSDSPAHAITPGGAPVVAWDDDRGDGEEIYVRTWNGATWAEIGNGSAAGGGISSTPGASTSPSVAIASDGSPIVAWEVSAGSDYEIYIRRWNGTAWVEMGGSASSGGVSNNSGGSYSPSLVVGSDGAPVVAWYDSSGGDWEIYVRRWNGSAWIEMGSGSAAGGGISNNSGSSRLPTLAAGPGGALIVTWEDESGGDWEVYTRQWNGTAWVEMGTGSASGGGISNNSGASNKPKSVIGPDGTTLIAWDDNSDGDAEIYVRRWNGSAWIEMANSASGGGVSNNSGSSYNPTPAIGVDGAPVVAWHDNSSTNWEAYVRRWNGSTWVEMDSGSASGGGISTNAGNSYSPVPVIAPDGRVFIVWADATSGNYEIYARSNPPVDVSCFNLSVSTVGSGSVVAVPDLDCYDDGVQVSLTATPGGGYIFTGWSGNLSGAANPAMLIMNSNKSVTATFTAQPPCYALTASHTGSGDDPTADPPNSPGCSNGQYIAGANINMTAYPAAGWVASSWSGTLNNTSTSIFNLVDMPAAAHTVIVNYSPACYTLVRQHTGSGDDPTANPTNSPGCPFGKFVAGASITMTAAPATGSRVNNWSGTINNGSSSINNTVVMPASNHIVMVNYVTECFTLVLQHTGDGNDPTPNPTNSPGCPGGQFSPGANIGLTAAPGVGSVVEGWTGTTNNSSTSTFNNTVMPASNHTVIVHYGSDTDLCYTLLLQHTGNGDDPIPSPPSSAGCPIGQFEQGESVSLTADPDPSWTVASWSGTTNNGSTSTTNAAIMPAGTHTVIVNYKPPACYRLLLTHAGQGSDPVATPSNSTGCDAGRYTAGQMINLTASPATGWRVKNWSGTVNNGSTATTNIVTMPATDHTATVHFELIPGADFHAYAPTVINVPPVCFPGPDEVEPNNRAAEANGPLCNGRDYRGRPQDNFDVFYLDIKQTGDIAVSLSNHTGSGVQFALHYQAITADPLEFDSNGSDGFRVDKSNAAPGRYYIVIYTETPNTGSSTKYTLQATFPE